MEDPALLVHWLFTSLALLVMATRLVWKWVSPQPWHLGDSLTVAAVVCALCRAGLIHVVLTGGTTNVPQSIRDAGFTQEQIDQRELGSRLALANRVFYNSYLWIQKFVLLDLYRRLHQGLPWEKTILWSFSLVFLGTYVACQVTTFTECRPVRLYWQLLPDPGPCAEAQLQLLVVGITNIVTDLMLLILPLPLVFKMKADWRRKIRYYTIFLLGIFIIAITIIRLPINALNKEIQANRSIWASTELFTSALVVNIPTLYGLWRHRRMRLREKDERHKYSHRSTPRGYQDGLGDTELRVGKFDDRPRSPGTSEGGGGVEGDHIDMVGLDMARAGGEIKNGRPHDVDFCSVSESEQEILQK